MKQLRYDLVNCQQSAGPSANLSAGNDLNKQHTASIAYLVPIPPSVLYKHYYRHIIYPTEFIQRCQPAKFKKGRQSSKIRENKGGFSTVIREEKCTHICDLNHTFGLNYLITALIFVLLNIFLIFSPFSLQFAMFTIVHTAIRQKFQ